MIVIRRLLLSFLLLLTGLGPLFGQRNISEYAVVLSEPPLSAQVRSRGELRLSSVEGRRRTIIARQSALRQELRRRGFRVTGSVHTLLNAIFVQAPAERVGELMGIEGVNRVALLPPMRRHMDQAAALIDAPAAWNDLGGRENAGAGVKIGFIDTGIDQNHPAFQDPALPIPDGYPKCEGSDCAYTNNKVIAARSYVYLLATGDPEDPFPPEDTRPDDLSPRDRVGHGTAVAMVGAGRTNTDPVTGLTITGVAPRAYVGNYKIFGSPGVNDYTFGSAFLKAIEDAFLDGMDVVSVSFGSPALYGPLDRGAACGSSDPNAVCDIRADAVENAVSKGMTVVVSAGNSGDASTFWSPTFSAIDSPGTAPSAITVGATTNAHYFSQSVRVPGDDVPAALQNIEAYFGDGPKPREPLTAPLADVAALDGTGKGCVPLPAGSLTRAIALIVRGDCFFFDKVNNAQTAGAVGVVVYNNDPAGALFSPSGLTETSIPAVMVANSAGTALRNFLATNPLRPVTLDPALAPQSAAADEMAGFSSTGPSTGENGLKPELGAVGVYVFTATQAYDPNSDMYDHTGYAAFSGTSFSAPQVAGAVALVKQAHPAATPGDLKSAVVNTAVGGIQDPITGQEAHPIRVGAGKLNVANAVASNIVVSPAALSFGKVTQWPPAPKTVRFTNAGATMVELSLGVPSPLTASRTALSLAPGASEEVAIGIGGARPDPDAWGGVIQVSGGAAPLRIPVLYLVGVGTPHDAFALNGSWFEGVAGEVPSPNMIAVKVLDYAGLPVQNARVRFLGYGGVVLAADGVTDVYGIAAARIQLGPNTGEQYFEARCGGLSVYFDGYAYPKPTIFEHGVVNAATGEEGMGLAPGSYISFYGTGLSPTTKAFSTPYLPLSLANVSVSFDTKPGDLPALSLPGRIHFVSPNQINVQIPPELFGRASVLTKVSYGDISTDVYEVALNDYSPAVFQYPIGAGLAAARYNGDIASAANPVPRGEGVVEIYCNGLGPVDQPVPAGEPAPESPLIRTTTPIVVTIGGAPAEVQFSGLTPTGIGLYQINVKPAADTPVGAQPVVITTGGVSSAPVYLHIR